MEHVVFWSAHSGAREFARVQQLPDAVELVERLRNSEGITDATVHSLTDVPVAFRTYYVAEVGAGVAVSDVAASAVATPSLAPEPITPTGEAGETGGAVDYGYPEAVPAIEPAGHPALSVVPERAEDPEPSPATESAAEDFSHSLGLFA